MKVLVTGRPGCGKTTLCEKVVDALKARKQPVGGIISKEIREGGTRVGFQLIDMATSEEGVLAHVSGEGPSVGKYRVNLDDIERVAVRAIEDAIAQRWFIVIDEIGPMELYSRSFIDAVEQAFESDQDVLATIHYRSRHSLVEKLKNSFDMVVLDEENRDAVARDIAGHFGLNV